MLQCFSLVNCDVIGFVTLDDVLRLIPRSMVQITFEANDRDHFLNDHAANSSRFRVPFNQVTALERLGHPIANNCERTRSDDAISKACQRVRYNFGITEAEISAERACKRCPANHLDFLLPSLESSCSFHLSHRRIGLILKLIRGNRKQRLDKFDPLPGYIRSVPFMPGCREEVFYLGCAAIASKFRRVNGNPSLSQNEWSESQSCGGICPTDSPYSVDK